MKMQTQQPNWDYVKKTTLWRYEDLIKKLRVVTAYPVIWQAYNHNMTQADAFARHLFLDKNIEAGEFPARILDTFEHLKSAGIKDWGSLLSKVSTSDKCASFVTEHNLNFEEFIEVLNYLLRWAFPFQTSSRELLEHESSQEMSCHEVLKRHKLMNSFDILEQGCTSAGRRALAKLTGLPLEFVTTLVHRADIARLPFVRRKTILPVCGAGYDTLAKIAAADLAQMESDMEAYFQRMHGKSWKNYKSVIVLKMLVTGAQALPVIMEE
jgi:hypothetical protein